jgi:hypothetical protein
MRLSKRMQALLGAALAAAATCALALPAAMRHEQLFGTGERTQQFRSAVPAGPL